MIICAEHMPPQIAIFQMAMPPQIAIFQMAKIAGVVRDGSQGEDSESEEIRFKLKVAAVVRVHGTANRYGMEPHQRFRPAVGGGGAAAELDMQVHRYARRWAEGVEFTLTSLTEKNDQ